MALHQATDIFAHSAYAYNGSKYIRVKHSAVFGDSGYDADKTNVIPARFPAAKQVAKNAIAHYFTNTPGTVGDFALSSTYYDSSFYLYQMNTFASAVNASNSALNKVDLAYNVNSSKYEIK